MQKTKKCLCIFIEKSQEGLLWKYWQSNLIDFKKFWKTLKLIFGSRLKSKNSITLVEGTKIMQEEGKLAQTFNKFFVSIANSLGINENLLSTSSSEARNIEFFIAKFERIVHSPLRKLIRLR